ESLLTVVKDLLVHRYARGDRSRTSRNPLQQNLCRGRCSGRCDTEKVRAPEQARERLLRLVHEPNPLAERAAEPRRGVVSPRRPNRRSPRKVRGQPAQSAEEEA